ncbi:disease resistance family protein/LRR family protein [Forsythia ovata]|uniref:Disease resistance family protein/LRR family protein n=1 Tax=Forsythia ovata TaxID=205694 RepID=A0ABD1UWF7_9LAMI
MELKRFIKLMNLLLFIFSLCMKPTSVSASGEVMCIERERQALLKFKRGLIDDGDILSSWGSGKDKRECCNWVGIKCNNESGHVIQLDLNQLYAYQLRGKVSPALLELQHLNYLDLSGFDFGGSQIPKFIGYIKNLTDLNLRNSNFTGNVPCQLGNLTNLVRLNLNGNNGLRVKNIEWLSRLSSLKYLDLTGVNLNETNWLPQIMKLRLLNILTLSDCQLHDNTLSAIDFVNSSFSSLYYLDLSKNYLTSSFTFQWLFNFTRYANRVDLSRNQLDGPIPDAFGELISLDELNLKENMLHGGIPKSLGNLSFYSVDISKNNLNKPLVELFHNLSETYTSTLDLSYNQLSGPFPDITRFSYLIELRLNNNHLRGFIPQSLGQASSIENLYLSHNQIGGKLLSNLSVFSQLEGLYVDSNSMEGTITEDHLSNLAKLVELDLSFNSLYLKLRSDWVPPFQLDVLRLKHCNLGHHFPKWLQTQYGLYELDMSFASISDTLPNWLWSLPSLEWLNLSHNNIGGRMPDLSSEFHFHKFTDLSYNNLSGPIPLYAFRSMEVQLSKNMLSGSISHICRISYSIDIKILDLSDNQLSGELPDCWMNKTDHLIVLNLANNRFCGKIPYTLGALDQLQTLHLRNNSLIGDLPSSLRNCMELRIIDLGENKLTGNIPAWIGTHLRNLSIVSLRFNKFQGNIPPTICQLTNIQILDLSRNNLSGKILQCLNNFTSMVQRNSSAESTEFIDPDDKYFPSTIMLHRYFDNILVQWKGKESEHGKLGLVKGIDLSSNKLVGTIPQQFSDMRSLVFLNLSRNHLTGNIISNIGQMETLEWLDLSRNHLSGEIPNSLALLHFLSVLDLSYNNLTGKIPLSTQLQSFNSSAYAGNNQLCGLPLVECPEDAHGPVVTDHGNGNSVEEDDKFITREFYICMAFGFITGFWAIVCTLYLKHSWRSTYFNFWKNIGDWTCVTMAIYVRRFKRKFQG